MKLETVIVYREDVPEGAKINLILISGKNRDGQQINRKQKAIIPK